MVPKTSIIVATYNCANFLTRALDSILYQDTDDYEVIVVDDGSTDNTQEILSKYANRIRIITKESNEGLPEACNTGIRAAKGEYIIRCDADDTVERQLVSSMSRALDANKEAGFAYCDYNVVFKDGRKVTVSLKEFDFFKMIATNTMFRKELLLEAGLYEKVFFEEYDLLARCMKLSKGMYVNEVLVNYFRHGGGMTEDKEKWKKGLEELRKRHKNLIPSNKTDTPQYVWRIE